MALNDSIDVELELEGRLDASQEQGVRALRLVNVLRVYRRVHSSSTAFCNLTKLRFLEIDDGIEVVGDLKGMSLPTKLVVGESICQLLFNPAFQRDLAILSLPDPPNHSLTRLSRRRLPDSFGDLKALRTLAIYGTEGSLPERFGELSALRSLYFRRCDFQRLPDSFGGLETLVKLDFVDCMSLESLCESFGRLRALEHLAFVDCHSVGGLPESFGSLSALKHLHFSDCGLKCLPRSFGGLSSLERLSLGGCAIRSLPCSFGDLSALTYLSFEHCPIQALPCSFGNLSALTHLSFAHCPIKILPDSFGKLSALTHLSFAHCPIQSVPESFGRLSALVYVSFDPYPRASDCRQSVFYPVARHWHFRPGWFSHLTNLQRMNLGSVRGALPDTLGSFPNLRYVQLWDCSITSLPDCIRNLTSLRCVEIIRAKPVVHWPPWLVVERSCKFQTWRASDTIYQVFRVRDEIVSIIEEGPVDNLSWSSQDGLYHSWNLSADIMKLLDSGPVSEHLN